MSPFADAVAPDSEGRSYGAQIRWLAEHHPDMDAVTVVAEDGSTARLDWRTLDRRSSQVARAFAAEGVSVGDRVGLELPNSVEMVEAVLASWKLGASPVPVRWDLPEWERARVARVLDAALLVGRDHLDLFERSRSLSDEPLPDVVAPAVNGICSSGSTGTPKIIMDHSPAVMTPSSTLPFPANWGVEVGRQVILVPTALYHTNGFAQFTYLLTGDSLVIMTKFDAELALDLIEHEHITAFTATPTMLARMARVPGVEQRDFSDVVWVQQGAAVFPPALARFWIDLLGGERIYMAYGMTERLGLTAIRGDEWLEHPGSIGRGFRDTELRILDEHQKEVPTGEVGEIYLRSSTTGRYGYMGADALPVTEDGFATAGDLGRLDEDGYCYVADRRVDMIVSGGANVFPAEVEAALSEHPEVVDVVVIGLPDAEWGRRVHAIIEPPRPSDPPDEEQIRSFAKERLAPYKVPKTVEFVDAIPRSAATKVNRAQLVADRMESEPVETAPPGD
ncbi:MAG: AMP-binding protein [Acidimicrobiales bacterium]|nr:AMP-binding protein [Acidimicrobiales bacterium]